MTSGWAAELDALAEAAALLEQRIGEHSLNIDIDTSAAWIGAQGDCSDAAADLHSAAAALRRAAAL